MRMMMAYLKDARGATAVEYGLIAALISVALIGSFTQFDNAFYNQYTLIANTMDVDP
ncbi:Flp family type IVb pilin [Rhizobiaceae bacterium n13]|uniref:Flp family type IVb pilin n=1 Tax=Ferirhizobium litorale TaxID=2927786 RepID=A0AAE3QJE6_9HYPH|nr:Flp family type IVb pilin [Fererhizobium litorale]MDI7864260.1 Flp family type IVb pilin [Fererhizobium litorale]MDI7924635.1 Flp family type IVb pilin [Fererhizobium litorale]